MLIRFCGFSQTILENDTLYSITAGQLRAACRIFVEHDYLKRENGLLKERSLLLESSGKAKDDVIRLQAAEIDALGLVIVKKEAIGINNAAAIGILKAQLAAERKKRKRYAVAGGGVGVVAGVVVMALKQ